MLGFICIVVPALGALFVASSLTTVLGVGFAGYVFFMGVVLCWGAWQNPKYALIAAGIVAFIAVMPTEVTIFALIGLMIFAWVRAARNWINEPIYAPQRRIKVRAIR